MQTPEHPVHIGEPGGDTRQLAATIIGGIGVVDRVVERGEKGLKAAIGGAGRDEVEQLCLGLDDLFIGRDVIAHGARTVRHTLAQRDQLAADGQIMDQLGVIARRRGGDGRKLEAQQIFATAQILQPGDIGHEILQRRGISGKTLGDAGLCHRKNRAVDGIVEMVGLDQIIDTVEHIVG